MSIQLNHIAFINTQQMEVAVNGPDGATHLILCTGIANLNSAASGIYTFMIGPPLSRRQFVSVIVSGALSSIQIDGKRAEGTTPRGACLLSITGEHDEESGKIMIYLEIISSGFPPQISVSYSASILAELPIEWHSKYVRGQA